MPWKRDRGAKVFLASSRGEDTRFTPADRGPQFAPMTVILRFLAAALAGALLAPAVRAQSHPGGALTGPGVSVRLA